MTWKITINSQKFQGQIGVVPCLLGFLMVQTLNFRDTTKETTIDHEQGFIPIEQIAVPIEQGFIPIEQINVPIEQMTIPIYQP